MNYLTCDTANYYAPLILTIVEIKSHNTYKIEFIHLYYILN